MSAQPLQPGRLCACGTLPVRGANWPHGLVCPRCYPAATVDYQASSATRRCRLCGSLYHETGAEGCVSHEQFGPDCFGGSDF